MDIGFLLTKATASAAFISYVTALMLRRSVIPFRGWWTAGCLALLIHSACAFHFVHHWSHRAAYESTARQTAALTGIATGCGLWLNYLLLLVWLGDMLWLDLSPKLHAARPRLITGVLHGFLAFMWFNATVIFGHGAARWLGVAGFAVLLTHRWISRRLNPRS